MSSGLIFTSLVRDDKPLVDKLHSEKVRFVQLDRRVADDTADWVGIDDYAGASEMASHVAATGQVATTSSRWASRTSAARSASAFQKTWHSTGLTT